MADIDYYIVRVQNAGLLNGHVTVARIEDMQGHPDSLLSFLVDSNPSTNGNVGPDNLGKHEAAVDALGAIMPDLDED